MFSVMSALAPIRQLRPIRAPLRTVAPSRSGIRSDSAAMQHRVMPDGAIVANRKRVTGIDVKDAVILNVASFADLDQLVVRPQHGAEPDTRFALRRTRPISTAVGATQHSAASSETTWSR